MTDPVSSLRILPVEIETPLPRAASQDGFSGILQGALDEVDELHSQAQEQIEGLLSGNGADVHAAMIAVEKADLSFQLMMQVRNKVVAAYQEISRMQF